MPPTPPPSKRPNAGAARSATPVQKGKDGRLKSARAKIGGQCSEAMSTWKTSGMTPAIAAVLGKCRSMARQQKAASSHRGADREGVAQHLEHRVAQAQAGKAPITAKDRTTRVKELLRQRAANRASAPAVLGSTATNDAQAQAAPAASRPAKDRSPAARVARIRDKVLAAEKFANETPTPGGRRVRFAQATRGFDRVAGTTAKAMEEGRPGYFGKIRDKRLRDEAAGAKAKAKAPASVSPTPPMGGAKADILTPAPAPATPATRTARVIKLAAPTGPHRAVREAEKRADQAVGRAVSLHEKHGFAEGGDHQVDELNKAIRHARDELDMAHRARQAAHGKDVRVPTYHVAAVEKLERISADVRARGHDPVRGRPRGYTPEEVNPGMTEGAKKQGLNISAKRAQASGLSEAERHNRAVRLRSLPKEVRRAETVMKRVPAGVSVADANTRNSLKEAVSRYQNPKAYGVKDRDSLLPHIKSGAERVREIVKRNVKPKPAPSPKPAPPAPAAFALKQSSAHAAPVSRFANTGGKTGYILDAVRLGDLPGQTTLMERYGTAHTSHLPLPPLPPKPAVPASPPKVDRSLSLAGGRRSDDARLRERIDRITQKVEAKALAGRKKGSMAVNGRNNRRIATWRDVSKRLYDRVATHAHKVQMASHPRDNR